MEVCSNCGEFVRRLDEYTGWCAKCSPVGNGNYAKIEAFLRKNADTLEIYISRGATLNQALDMMADPKDRPSCVVCGKPIKHAPRASLFCRRTPQCRAFSRRYVYLYRERGLSKPRALGVIFDELAGG